MRDNLSHSSLVDIRLTSSSPQHSDGRDANRDGGSVFAKHRERVGYGQARIHGARAEGTVLRESRAIDGLRLLY